MTVYQVRHKPTFMSAIQWRGDNEGAVRNFVLDDTMLQFKDGGILRVWNQMDMSWIDCPVFHYVVMDVNRNLYPVSPACFRDNYTIESSDAVKGPAVDKPEEAKVVG